MLPRTRRNIIGLSLLALLAVAVVLVLVYLHYRSTHINTDDAFVDAKLYYVSPRISGRVVELLVDDNQYVEADDLLVRLDPRDIEAELRVAQANLALAQNQVTAQRSSVGVAAAQQRQLEPQVAVARRDVERIAALVAQGGATEQQLDEARARLRTLEAQATAAREQVVERQATVGAPQPSGMVAQVELAEARVQQLQLNLEHTFIRAPHSGFISRRSIAHGAYVQPGQLLMAVVPLHEVYITANYKETQLTRVRPGQRVEIHVDTYPNSHLVGRVQSIQAGTGAAFSLIPPQNATGNYIKVVQRIPVRIDLEPTASQPVLRVGMSVEPTILIEEP